MALAAGDLTVLGDLGRWLQDLGVRFDANIHVPILTALSWIIPLLAIVWLMPNSQQLLQKYRPILEPVTGGPARPRWRPNALWATVMALMFVLCLMNLNRPTTFLYFQF